MTETPDFHPPSPSPPSINQSRYMANKKAGDAALAFKIIN